MTSPGNIYLGQINLADSSIQIFVSSSPSGWESNFQNLSGKCLGRCKEAPSNMQAESFFYNIK